MVTGRLWQKAWDCINRDKAGGPPTRILIPMMIAGVGKEKQ